MGVFAGKNEGITPGLGKVATASAVSAGASAGSGPATRPVVESQPLGAAQTLPLPLAATVLSAVFMLGLSLIA